MKLKLVILALLVCGLLRAEDNPGKVKVYGEVNNYATFSSRNGVMDETGLFYLLPADQSLNAVGMDMNNANSVRFLSLASKLGFSWDGFAYKNMELGAKIEADFYCANGVNNFLRLRKAYFTAAWDFGKWNKLSVLAGQNWHPFAIDAPHTISMTSGAPFNPYSFAPQAMVGYEVLDWLSVSLGALWQMDYKSTGPQGFSTKYIEWSCIPECFLGVDFKYKAFRGRLGGEVLSIKPRQQGLYPYTDVPVWVSDAITTFSAFAYGEYTWKDLNVRAKTTYAQGGEHLMMFGGYGIRDSSEETGSCTYSPLTSSASWVSAQYGKALKGMLLLGYLQNLGSTNELAYNSSSYIYYRSDLYNLARAFRVAPAVTFTYKHLKVGLEYEFTGAQYGNASVLDLQSGLAEEGLHWVYSHRITVLAACVF